MRCLYPCRGVTGRDLRFMVSADEVRGIQGWFIRRLGGFQIPSTQLLPPSVMESSYSSRRNAGHFSRRQHLRDGSLHPLKPGQLVSCQYRIEPSGLGVKIVPISICYINPSALGLRCPNCTSPLQVADYCTNSVNKTQNT